ncbi:MAG TPA: aspartyl protease family protein [Phycisphaerae bacterium]|nr:aspartyl protease family protein [Phycisphaerae bacterium]HNU43930.1 aspartyl protease family protein [Phycisphaerae bacterium]
MTGCGNKLARTAGGVGLLVCLAFGGITPAEDEVARGDALFRAGQFAEAEKAYAAARTAGARSFEATVRLGEIALLGNRFPEAERLLQEAIAMQPDTPRPKELLAEAFCRQDKFAQAAELVKQVGPEAEAAKLSSFQGSAPYEIAGATDAAHVKFVRTDPLPVIRARFNGKEEGLLLVDTGASELYLDKALVEKLALSRFGSTTGMYAGGRTAEVGHARLDSIQLGDLEVRNVPVVVRSGGAMLRLPDQEPPVGVIGTVMFYHFFTTLDYPQGELVLRRRTDVRRAEVERLAQDSRTHVVPFWMAGTHTMVAWGKVNDSPPLLMFADTGLAGGGFLCPESTLKDAGIDISGLPSFQGMGGGGPVTVTPFKIERLSFGAATASGITGFFGGFPPASEYDKGFRVGGIISHEFFKRFALTFDFEKMRFLLTPAP